jgi:hypothetical protein
VESKTTAGAARWTWLYRSPWVPVVLGVPLGVCQAVYVTACWLRAGVREPLLMFPAMVAAKLAYGVGMTVGGLRWLLQRHAVLHSATARHL